MARPFTMVSILAAWCVFCVTGEEPLDDVIQSVHHHHEGLRRSIRALNDHSKAFDKNVEQLLLAKLEDLGTLTGSIRAFCDNFQRAEQPQAKAPPASKEWRTPQAPLVPVSIGVQTLADDITIHLQVKHNVSGVVYMSTLDHVDTKRLQVDQSDSLPKVSRIKFVFQKDKICDIGDVSRGDVILTFESVCLQAVAAELVVDVCTNTSFTLRDESNSEADESIIPPTPKYRYSLGDQSGSDDNVLRAEPGENVEIFLDIDKQSEPLNYPSMYVITYAIEHPTQAVTTSTYSVIIPRGFTFIIQRSDEARYARVPTNEFTMMEKVFDSSDPSVAQDAALESRRLKLTLQTAGGNFSSAFVFVVQADYYLREGVLKSIGQTLPLRVVPARQTCPLQNSDLVFISPSKFFCDTGPDAASYCIVYCAVLGESVTKLKIVQKGGAKLKDTPLTRMFKSNFWTTTRVYIETEKSGRGDEWLECRAKNQAGVKKRQAIHLVFGKKPKFDSSLSQFTQNLNGSKTFECVVDGGAMDIYFVGEETVMAFERRTRFEPGPNVMLWKKVSDVDRVSATLTITGPLSKRVACMAEYGGGQVMRSTYN